jgi:oligopeptidase B
LAPDLFRGAVAEVPFVDVLTTMLDASLPLTPPEWPEWGNPIESRDAYELIAGYAPYENITATRYPHILATAGLTDPRVTYWEPAKWIARLRDTRTDGGLSLLRTEMTAGHGGKAGRYNQLHEIAFVYAFVLSIHNQ